MLETSQFSAYWIILNNMSWNVTSITQKASQFPNLENKAKFFAYMWNVHTSIFPLLNHAANSFGSRWVAPSQSCHTLTQSNSYTGLGSTICYQVAHSIRRYWWLTFCKQCRHHMLELTWPNIRLIWSKCNIFLTKPDRKLSTGLSAFSSL